MNDSLAGKTPPTVSVVIPAYNATKYLETAVSSALGQSFADLEVIVVDDGSTDETPQVIASFGERIRSVRRENGGVAEALNTGIGEARGRYVSLLAADDILAQGATETCVALLEADPDAGFVHGAAYEIDEGGRLLNTRVRGSRNVVTEKPRPAVKRLLRGNTVVCSSVMIRKAALDKVGGFRQECMPGEDWEMWLRLAARHNVIYTRTILAKYRIHDQSLTAGFELGPYEAAHLRTLHSLFDEGRIGEHRDLEGYAFAAHLRTMASMAAYLRQPLDSWRYLGRAVSRRPSLILEPQTWAAAFEAVKSLLPRGAIRLGSALKERLRGKMTDLEESKKPAS